MFDGSCESAIQTLPVQMGDEVAQGSIWLLVSNAGLVLGVYQGLFSYTPFNPNRSGLAEMIEVENPFHLKCGELECIQTNI